MSHERVLVDDPVVNRMGTPHGIAEVLRSATRQEPRFACETARLS